MCKPPCATPLGDPRHLVVVQGAGVPGVGGVRVQLEDQVQLVRDAGDHVQGRQHAAVLRCAAQRAGDLEVGVRIVGGQRHGAFGVGDGEVVQPAWPRRRRWGGRPPRTSGRAHAADTPPRSTRRPRSPRRSVRRPPRTGPGRPAGRPLRPAPAPPPGPASPAPAPGRERGRGRVRARGCVRGHRPGVARRLGRRVVHAASRVLRAAHDADRMVVRDDLEARQVALA